MPVKVWGFLLPTKIVFGRISGLAKSLRQPSKKKASFEAYHSHDCTPSSITGVSAR